MGVTESRAMAKRNAMNRFWDRLTLQNRLALVMTVSGLMIALGILAGSLSVVARQYTDAFGRQQQMLLEGLAQGVDDQISSALRALDGVAAVMPSQALFNQAEAEQYLNNRIGSQHIFDNGLALFTRTGRLVAETPKNPDRTIWNFAGYPFFKDAVRVNRPIVSQPFRSTKPSHHTVVQFLVPIKDATDHTLGFLSGGISLQRQNFLGALARKDIGKNGALYLFGRDRTMLVASDASTLLAKDQAFGINSLFDHAVSGRSGSGVITNLQGIRQIASFRPLTQASWILVATFPEAEAHAPMRTAVRFLTVLTLLLGTLGGIISWRLARSLTAPLSAFSCHLEQLPRLAGDERYLQILGSPELQRLSESFNSMLAELDKREATNQWQLDELGRLEQETRRMARLYRILSAINQKIVHKPSAMELFQFTCDTLVSDENFVMAWVGIQDGSGGYFPAAAAGISRDQLVELCSGDSLTQQLDGTAGLQVVGGINDENAEQLLCPPCLNLYRIKPFHAQWIYNICPEQALTAVLAVYAKTEDLFDDRERGLMDELVGDLVYALDIEEQERHQRQIQHELNLAASVFENSSEGIIVTDPFERILLVNRAFSEVTGYSPEEVSGQTPRLLKSDRHERDFYQALWQALQETGSWRGEIWNRRKNGELYPALLSINAVKERQGKISNYIAVFSDISRIKNSEQKLDYLSLHDPLTDLPNRQMLCLQLTQAIARAEREKHKLALLCLDLDHFKDVNDSFGYLTGDDLLRLVAQRLKTRVRGSDLLARLGGDEFIILLEGIEEPAAVALIAQDLLQLIQEPFQLAGGIELRTGVSIGIAIYPDHAKKPMELLQRADAALFRANNRGRLGFAFFSEEFTAQALERLEIGNLLRRAIERNELHVVYQPQVELASGRIVGAEALLRWQSRELGMISPSRFIPLAEEIGCIVPLGEWILREACRQGRVWLDAGLPPIVLAVNLSPHQFHQVNLLQLVTDILVETGFTPEYLELEVTESALMQQGEETISLLLNLRKLGVRLALDDFGTGYSSLAYLKYFPMHLLKIDKSFVDDIPHGAKDLQLVSTIIYMARCMGFKVLAEGVERQEQLDTLRELECDMYQGYLMSKPLAADEFVTLLDYGSNRNPPL